MARSATKKAAVPLTAEQRDMVEANRGLAARVARDFAARCPAVLRWHDVDDMIQAAMLGLMNAARGFDATLGFKFSTYATWACLREVQALWAERLVRLPKGVVRPSCAEAAARTEYVVSLDQAAKCCYAADADADSWANQVPDPREHADPADAIDAADLLGRVRSHWGLLTDCERAALEGVFGEGRTLVSVAREHGVSKERARQWLDQGVRRLRLACVAGIVLEPKRPRPAEVA